MKDCVEDCVKRYTEHYTEPGMACAMKRRYVPDVEIGVKAEEQEIKRLKLEHGFARIWIIIYQQIKNWVADATLRTPL